MSLIGRQYIPTDNSYSVNLTKPMKLHPLLGRIENTAYLAGTQIDRPKICIIRSLPLDIQVDTGTKLYGKEKTKMIIVEEVNTGDYHLVMYHKKGLLVEERLEAIERVSYMRNDNL